ncbi:hypothetical protein ACOSP7_005821 [Xanthoceras sorbifolium]
MISNIVQDLMERLRPLVGLKGWDYCVLWKLSDDQRFIEWMDCCCAGAAAAADDQNMINGGDDHHEDQLHFPVVSPVLPCRDAAFHRHHQLHPRTKSCELLSQLSSSMPIEAGNIYAQTLISNQPRWFNFSNNPSNSDAMEETVWTRILIPIVGGLLIELFVTKEVPEDLHVIDFITAQCSISFHDHDHQEAANLNMDENNHDLFPPPSTALDNLEHVPYDISVDRIRLSSSAAGSPMNLLQQFSYNSTTPTTTAAAATTNCDQNNRTNNDHHHVFFDGSSHHHHHHHHHNHDHNSSFLSPHHHEIMDVEYMDHHHHQEEQQQQQGNNNNNNNVNSVDDKDSFNRLENGRSDSVSDCSDQIDDEDDGKYRRRANGKGTSKNLVAERKRRKKLNDRLYALRSLVPNISKLDRASILGDAIDFVKELQKQAKELQDELEEHSDDDGAKSGGGNNNNVKSEIFSQNGTTTFGPKTELDHHNNNAPNGFHLGASGTGNNNNVPKQDPDTSNDKAQQMEVQVEVAQLDGNAFFVKVFCEHKPGGFMRLMEALNSLGLEVTNANVTSFLGLVSNVFKVEKRDSEMVQADHVRDSLLELTRDPTPSRGWPDQIEKSTEGVDGVDYRHHHNHNHHHHHHDHHLNNHHVAAPHHHHYLHHLHN